MPVGDVGAQRPRIEHFPEYEHSVGEVAIRLAERAGLELDDWQQYVLVNSLGERTDGKWAASTVGIVCPRQNGKNAILEARELVGLFLLREQVIIHSAHEQATATEQFRRLLELMQGVPEFDRRILKVVRGKGSEAIELRSGQRILFKTRTGGGARGFSIDCIVFDEAYELPETAISAMVPTLSARPNTQTWYASSAVDQDKHQHGIALARQREAALAEKPGIAYFEWSVDGENPGRVSREVREDPDSWVRANPGFGIRISSESIQRECYGGMGAREFAVERLGIGDWPDTSEDAGRIIGREAWAALGDDPANKITSNFMFAVDVNPSLTKGAIGVAGKRDDGLFQFALVEHRRGTDWIVDSCVELQKEFRRAKFVVDKRGFAASHIDDLLAAKVRVEEVSTDEYGNACMGFIKAAGDRRCRYPRPQPELDEAVANAVAKPMGDRFKWDRRESGGADISPLVAVTLALWGTEHIKPRTRIINLSDL